MPEHRAVLLAQAIGRRIRLLRYAEHGEGKREQFLRDMHISKSALDRVERGEKFPAIPFMASLKEKYGVTYEWLLDGDERRMPHELVNRINALAAEPSDKPD